MNECGDCSVCCNIFTIKELNKKEKTNCSHLCESGCKIYSTRPRACSSFECVFLKSDWPVELRPDKSGVIIANYPFGYQAIRLTNEVSKEMMKKIGELKKQVHIQGVDAR